MNIKYLVLFFVITLSSSIAQLDRSIQPKPGPAPEIKIGDFESFKMDNGLKVFVIENNKLPKVTFSLIVDRDPILEEENMGYVSLAGDLLRRGTKNRSKEQIDEEIDFIGANLTTSGAGISGSSLKKHFNTLVELFSDVLLNPEFKQDELDKLKTQMISGITAGKEDPNVISGNVRSAVLYGKDHPYGEVITEESVKSVDIDQCKKFYEEYFRPNVSYLALVGDITLDEAKEITKKYLGDWKSKDVPSFEYKTPKAPLVRKVSLADRASSVQSVISVAYPIDLKKDNEDVIKVSVMNTILGGPFSSRLNQNLREKNGYTYGAGSRISSDKFVGNFTASTTVRNSATDSAVTEIFNEMKRMRSELVDSEELTRIKNYLTGSFSRSLESPSTIARFALNIERHNLPKDFYKNYLKNLNAVTAEDVQKMAKKYLKPKKSHVIVVGNADEIKGGLKKFSTSGKIKYYDYYGDEYDPNLKKVDADITAESIIEKYIEAIGGREKIASIKDKTMKLKGAAQGMDLSLTISQKAPNKLFQELDFSVGTQTTVFDGTSAKIEGMGQVQNLTGEKLEELKHQSKLNPFLSYLEDGVQLSIKGIETINDQDAYQIILTAPTGKIYTHYYGVESGLKLREISEVSTPQGSFTQTIDMSDYRDVDGIKFPFILKQKMGPRTVELIVESIKLNTNLSDSLFKVD